MSQSHRFLVAAVLLAVCSSLWAETGPGPATAPTTAPAQMKISVRALIDGRSQLILKGNTAQWKNIDFAAPGLHAGRNEPTTINGVKWLPDWDDSDINPEVRIAKATSSVFEKLTPALPAAAMNVTLKKIQCRDDATIIQQPTAANEFTTIVEFNDDDMGGSDWYELELTFTPAP